MMDVVYWIRGEAHAKLAVTSIASVKKAYPAAIFCYADEAAMKVLDQVEEIAVYPEPSNEPLMVANVVAQAEHLSRHDCGRQVWFLDSDVLVRQFPVMPMYHAAALAVTYRHSVGMDEEGNPITGVAKLMPYNYGVVGASPEAASVFTLMADRIRRMAPNHRHWYGNQLALAELCGSPPETGTIRRHRWFDRLNQTGPEFDVTYLPCDEYNQTPRGLNSQAKILHFKGGSRPKMEAYAKEWGLPWLT